MRVMCLISNIISMSANVFDYRAIVEEGEAGLNENFEIGEMTNSDPMRESKDMPRYKGEFLRFATPWMFCRFGYGGQYNSIMLSTQSHREFTLEDESDKKTFKQFVHLLETNIKNHVVAQPNPDMLSTNMGSLVTYDEKYSTYKYNFFFPKKHLDKDGEFQGKVFKSTNLKDPEYSPSSIKAIEENSYVQLIGYIGKISQSKTGIRFHVVVEQVAWFPLVGINAAKEEIITGTTNMFLNVPCLGKRKVKAQAQEPEQVDTDYPSSAPKNKSTKKTKVDN